MATATASSAAADAAQAVDADPSTLGEANPHGAATDAGSASPARIRGLTLRWVGSDFASRYDVLLSEDGRGWTRVRSVAAGNGGADWIALQNPKRAIWHWNCTTALVLRTRWPMQRCSHWLSPLRRMRSSKPWPRTPTRMVSRGFTGEQTYWTSSASTAAASRV